MSTSSSNTAASTKAAKKGPGFFELSTQTLQNIAKLHLGPDALCAYIVLAGGVNSGEKTIKKASTHSAKSIHRRTMMSRTTAANNAMNALEKAGIIQSAPVELTSAQNKIFRIGSPRWIVDPKATYDLAVAQSFLQPRDDGLSADEQTTPGTLAHLCHVTRNDDMGDIPFTNALIDALLIFFALHRRQEFERFAGVDPCAVGGRFEPIDDEEDGDQTAHAVAIEGTPSWLLVTERSPTKLVISAEFAEEALGCVQAWEGAPTVVKRAHHALDQLRRAELIYKATVLWDVNPINPPLGRFPQPLHTLYVHGSWASEHEHQLQNDVHKVMLRTRTRTGHQVFGESRGLEASWVRSGHHRFMLPEKQFGKAVLMSQLRVRWWPQNKDTIGALQTDQKRIKHWRDRLDDVATQSEAALEKTA